MSLSIHKDFLDALAKLSKTDQKRVHNTLEQILASSESSGLRLHKVGEFWSYSVSMSIRILAWKKGGDILMMFVGQHDIAYRWAEQYKPVLNEDGAFIGIINSAVAFHNKSLSITNIDAGSTKLGKYLALGLGETFSKFLVGLDDDQLLESILAFAPEYQEAILDIAAGNDADIKDAKPSDIVVINDDFALSYALSLPTEKWHVFLHPKQQFAVEIPNDRHVFLRGGPGTGKTVVLLHRFVKYQLLAHSEKSSKKPIFFCANKVTQTILQTQLSKMQQSQYAEFVIPIDALLRLKQTEFKAELQKYSMILIDEGQDIPLQYISKLQAYFDEDPFTIPPHFIAYDANQAILSASGDGLKRLEKNFDNLSLTYSYRATQQNVSASIALLKYLHLSYGGKDFQHQHHISASQDSFSIKYLSPLQGPSVVIERLKTEEIVIRLISTFADFRKLYLDDSSLALILINFPQDNEIKNLILQDETLSKLLISPQQAKGHEYHAGIVLDTLHLNTRSEDMKYTVTRSQYQTLLGGYVALTRFRDRVNCFYLYEDSPFSKI